MEICSGVLALRCSKRPYPSTILHVGLEYEGWVRRRRKRVEAVPSLQGRYGGYLEFWRGTTSRAGSRRMDAMYGGRVSRDDSAVLDLWVSAARHDLAVAGSSLL